MMTGTRHIPFVFLTAGSAGAKRSGSRAWHAAQVDDIRNPFEPDELYENY